MPPLQIHKSREKPALFCACEQQSSCALTRGMNFDHFMAVGARDSFKNFLQNKNSFERKKSHHVD